MERRRLIGYWKSIGLDPKDENWPDPSWFIDVDCRASLREQVSLYLSTSGVIFKEFLGPSWCRICDRNLGSLEMTDGVYDWPEGLAHYVSEHSIRLPTDFVDHVVSKAPRRVTGDLERDETWWSTQKGIDPTRVSPYLSPAQWVFEPSEWHSKL